MKKTLLSLALLLTAMTAAAQDDGVNNWHFSDNADGTATVVCFEHDGKGWINGIETTVHTKLDCYGGDAVIPSKTPDGKTVTAIGDECFRACPGLTSLKIPSSIKRIGKAAIQECSALKEISVPGSVEFLDRNAIWNCDNLERLIIEDSPNTLTTPSGYEMFRTLRGLKYIYQGRNIITSEEAWPVFCQMGGPVDTIEIGPEVTEIPEHGYEYNKSLRTVVMSPNITVIPQYAFNLCEVLETVTWPSGLTDICESAFSQCKALKTLPDLSHCKRILQGAFAQCEAITKVVIPATVDTLGYGAFSANTALEEVIIEDCERPLKMGSGEMFGRPAPNLRKAYLGRDYEGGQYGVFQWNPSIEEVTIGGYATKLRAGEFTECKALKTVHLGERMKEIADGAFGSWAAQMTVSTLICDAVEPPVCLGNTSLTPPIDAQTCKLYVPAESVDAYKAAFQWKEFFNIESGITAQQSGAASVSSVYTLGGQRTAGTQRGLLIQRMSDGSVRKVITNK